MSLDTRRAKVAAYAQRYNRELSEVIVDAADADGPAGGEAGPPQGFGNSVA